MRFPVIKGVACILAHVPDLVPYGSKPLREIRNAPKLLVEVKRHLRTYEEAVEYPPHQAFIGNLLPDDLWNFQQPWYTHVLHQAPRSGPYGEIMPEDQFYGLLKAVDRFNLVHLEKGFMEEVREKLQAHPLSPQEDVNTLTGGIPLPEIESRVRREEAIPLRVGERIVGCVLRDHEEDETLTAPILLENLACKATGVLALRHLLRPLADEASLSPQEIDYIIGGSEEAVGDRYQRGGGSLGKAIGEMAGLINASGADVKAFCTSPMHAVILAGALVQAGIFRNVAVVAGGSLPKLGMKFKAHLKKEMPVLEDVLGGVAVIVGTDDRRNPIIRTDAVGMHNIGTGTSQQALTEALVLKPLEKLGRRLTDVAKYATEMHNPEITVPAGSGNVPHTNYRMIAALAALRGEIGQEEMELFVRRHGMPGYAPTQGHIASAICFLGQARDGLRTRKLRCAMFLAKGSLFLGRMTEMPDGVSFLLEPNPA